MKLKRFIQQETVLTVAIILAVISALFVCPDRQYIGYIDFRTLGMLFSLMTVMAGLRRQGVFERVGQALLERSGGMLTLVLVLVGLCFFGSMFITNDVALLTFVPFTFAVLGNMEEEIRSRLAVPVVCMQTVAANLGSMLTPMGNPQNLYLYGKSSVGMGPFVCLMFPYTMVSLVLLIGWTIGLCYRQKGRISTMFVEKRELPPCDKRIVAFYGFLFVICLLSVVHILPYGIVFILVLAVTVCVDRLTLPCVDYSLLLTFVAFFIFIGNLGRIPVFSTWLQEMVSGREVFVAVLASQVTSNVPAALLLSGFTSNTEALIIGTNLGGLGTLIASMASLISYRQIAREIPQSKGKYFRMFTISNLIFLGILLVVYLFLDQWA